MGEKSWLLLNQRIYQATKDGCGIIDSHIGSLAEKEGYIRIPADTSGQFVDDAAQKHCLAFAGISPDPKETAALVVLPLFEFFVVKNPAI
jgi:hypothetical protein